MSSTIIFGTLLFPIAKRQRVHGGTCLWGGGGVDAASEDGDVAGQRLQVADGGIYLLARHAVHVEVIVLARLLRRTWLNVCQADLALLWTVAYIIIIIISFIRTSAAWAVKYTIKHTKMIQKGIIQTKLILKIIKPNAVLNTCNITTNNVMRFDVDVEFSSPSKDTGITILCQSAQNQSRKQCTGWFIWRRVTTYQACSSRHNCELKLLA